MTPVGRGHFVEPPTKYYQDEAATRDSRLKAVWDNEIEDLKNKHTPYKKAFVLLLSWDKEIDDLKTEEEVTALDDLFKQKFMYKTTRGLLTKDSRRTAQVQVNRHLAEFVDKHDDTNTLLIIYYAGHGRPGNSRGTLKLTGSTSVRTEEDSELHEIVWSSAEHNIKNTRADVLVIFDCCHAGELERTVRGHYNRRAFEFLAATSANSTTRKPGIKSFTSALIWSLSHLVHEKGSFSTQELLHTILNDAPNFPEHQYPRLSERQHSQRKIMIAPLTEESVKQASEASNADDDEYFDEELRQDILVRFVFDQDITESTIKEIASHMQRLIHDRDIKAKTVSWEGINMPTTQQYMVAQPWIRHFSTRLNHIRNRAEASPIVEVSPPGPSTGGFDGAAQGFTSSSATSVDENFVSTPDLSRSAEPDIGEDQGVSPVKPLSLDTGRYVVLASPNLNNRGRNAHTLSSEMPSISKRGREVDHDDHDSSTTAKRGRFDEPTREVRERFALDKKKGH